MQLMIEKTLRESYVITQTSKRRLQPFLISSSLQIHANITHKGLRSDEGKHQFDLQD